MDGKQPQPQAGAAVPSPLCRLGLLLTLARAVSARLGVDVPLARLRGRRQWPALDGRSLLVSTTTSQRKPIQAVVLRLRSRTHSKATSRTGWGKPTLAISSRRHLPGHGSTARGTGVSHRLPARRRPFARLRNRPRCGGNQPCRWLEKREAFRHEPHPRWKMPRPGRAIDVVRLRAAIVQNAPYVAMNAHVRIYRLNGCQVGIEMESVGYTPVVRVVRGEWDADPFCRNSATSLGRCWCTRPNCPLRSRRTGRGPRERWRTVKDGTAALAAAAKV